MTSFHLNSVRCEATILIGRNWQHGKLGRSVDDVIFSHRGASGASCVFLVIAETTASIPAIFCYVNQILSWVEHSLGTKSAVYDGPVTHDGGNRVVGRVLSDICDFGCMTVRACPRTKWKTARAINTKLDRHRANGSRSACSDPEIKKSSNALPERVCMSLRLLRFSLETESVRRR